MKFRGKSNSIIWLLSAAMLAATVYFASQRSEFANSWSYWVTAAGFGITAALILSFAVRNYIIVSGRRIRICLGPITVTVPTGAIQSMVPVTNFIALPGAPAKRIEIVYMKDGLKRVIFVSPRDEDGFMEAVCSQEQD